MADTYTYTQVRRVDPKGGSIVGLTPATITGFGFAFATGIVTFGGVAATDVDVVNNTTITVTVPAHVAGSVDVVVEGVGTGVGIYTYANPSTVLLPRVPVKDDFSLDIYGAPKWLMVVKQRIETAPIVGADAIIGTLSEDQIPELPWSKINKTGSSLADLTIRSASDLTSGILRQPYGGTGRANAYSFAPGSFTVQDGTFAFVVSHLDIGTNDIVTVLGSGILAVL